MFHNITPIPVAGVGTGVIPGVTTMGVNVNQVQINPAVAVASAGGAVNTTQQKHDIFVGNLDFNTTEEQLHQIFSEIGRLVRVRMVTDQDTGKPRGFAFVEFEDPQAALAAIRNMNDYELNGRRIRVNFSNASHLEALAGKLGMDLPNTQTQANSQAHIQTHTQQTTATIATPTGSASISVADAIKGMSKGELYDVVEKLKEIADRDPEEARRLLSSHPQLPEAILLAMSKLEMIQTPASTTPFAQPSSLPAPTGPVDPRQRLDPRQQAQQAQQPPPQPTQQQQPQPPVSLPPSRADPRARMDPRRVAPTPATAVAVAAPPPPPPPIPQITPPPPPALAAATAPPPMYSSAPPNLDPALVQQVMSLTMEQISQLPPEQSQSIMALRSQITGGHR